MLIKICSLRDPENIAQVARLSPNYMGFDFRSSSPWYIGEVDETLLHPIDATIRKIGIFNDENTATILSTAGRFGLNAIQIEGNKNSDALEILSSEGLEIIKGIDLRTKACIEQALRYEGVVNKFIFHIPSPQQMALIEQYRGTTPFLVSSDSHCVPLDILLECASHPLMCGIDTSTSFEFRIGKKDIAQLADFISAIKSFKSTI